MREHWNRKRRQTVWLLPSGPRYPSGQETVRNGFRTLGEPKTPHGDKRTQSNGRHEGKRTRCETSKHLRHLKKGEHLGLSCPLRKTTTPATHRRARERIGHRQMMNV